MRILYSFLFTLFLLLPLGANSTLNIQNGINQYAASGYRTALSALYKAQGYQPLWVGNENAEPFAQLLDALGDPLYNYKFHSFHQDRIIDLSFAIESGTYSQEELPSQLTKLDILASESYLRLIRFIRIGDVDWGLVKRKLKNLKASQDVRATWEIRPKSMPTPEQILGSITQRDIAGYLSSLLPLTEQYTALVTMLERYRAMPSFKKIPFGKNLKPGRTDSRIRAIKKLLKFTGDFPQSESTGTGYTKSLGRAIQSFKERFNLTPGNYIDNKTIKYLNTTKSHYVKKILTNLDMLRLQPHRFESNHVQINVPEFKLRYYQDGIEAFQSDIIVGRIDRPTPLFSDKIDYMVLNPTWTITDNLVRRDLIPVLRTNPNYLQEHNIHVFNSYKKGAKEVPLDLDKLFGYEHSKRAIPYRFVQYPSEQNALGKVKFMFPNKYAVYLHDTDNKSLFKYRYRVYSSGCMRVKRPYDFMYALLDNAGNSYSAGNLQQIFESNKTTTIRLKRSIPVHVLYQTVRQKQGQEYFFYDVYMYEQIVYESTAGHKKASFRVPEKRLTKVERIGARIR